MEMFESIYASQVAVASFVALVMVAAASDIVSYRIPNVVVIMMLALYPIYVLVTPGEVEWLYSLGIFAVSMSIGLVFFAMKWFGAGDVKLMAAVMLWAGPTFALPALIIACLVGGAVALIMLTGLKFVVASVLSSVSGKTLGEKFLAHSMPWGIGIGVSGMFTGWALMVGL